MVRVVKDAVYTAHGRLIETSGDQLSQEQISARLVADGAPALEPRTDVMGAADSTIAWQVLSAHNTGDSRDLRIRFDALASHDITYVGIIQTARASGLKRFPVPYVLTNCHNSLCAVGGTINEDDHVFGLSAAQKYGGIFVPAHQAVIHTYMREEMAGCGKMILGSDSHTRYGALGTMAIGEGGPELVKQILSHTYDIKRPDTILVWLRGRPRDGVGPQDVALALIAEVFNSGFAKNKILEFDGPGLDLLSVDYRCGIDVMTTETTCLSSIWRTDDKVREFLKEHGRGHEYSALSPGALAYYQGAIVVDLDKVEPMIALPFHPANVYSLKALKANAADILRAAEVEGEKALETPGLKLDFVSKLRDGQLWADQGVIAGCSGGTFENIMAAAEILSQQRTGEGEFWLSVYPGSQPVNLELTKNGAAARLMAAGVSMRSAFCGPCFGAGDVPANMGFSIRHTTRNFPSREGSKPGSGQIASVALMDARSIAATAARGGRLTGADEIDFKENPPTYHYDRSPYNARVFQGFGKAREDSELKYGPNIADWPKMPALPEDLVIEVVSVIRDPVTTTDELIPSGETSSYRSNPHKLAEFTLSRKDPGYVDRAKSVRALYQDPQGFLRLCQDLNQRAKTAGLGGYSPLSPERAGLGSTIFARKPGDGSAREQAASCQRVLGAWANLAVDYATKRYRSNLVNWGMLPFVVSEADSSALAIGDVLVVSGISKALREARYELTSWVFSKGGIRPIGLSLPAMEEGEAKVILAGCLMNYYAGSGDK